MSDVRFPGSSREEGSPTVLGRWGMPMLAFLVFATIAAFVAA
ncbi:hypothetical protein [Modestobacter roseus]|nr:hypothetical protein [Modestobacter roseus]